MGGDIETYRKKQTYNIYSYICHRQTYFWFERQDVSQDTTDNCIAYVLCSYVLEAWWIIFLRQITIWATVNMHVVKKSHTVQTCFACRCHRVSEDTRLRRFSLHNGYKIIIIQAHLMPRTFNLSFMVAVDNAWSTACINVICITSVWESELKRWGVFM